MATAATIRHNGETYQYRGHVGIGSPAEAARYQAPSGRTLNFRNGEADAVRVYLAMSVDGRQYRYTGAVMDGDYVLRHEYRAAAGETLLLTNAEAEAPEVD